MAYTKTDWENAPSTRTPVSRDNMNHIENGIYDNSINIGELINLNTTTKSSLVAAINEVLSTANGTVLWTNSDPSQNFGPQNIELSSGDYDELILYCCYTSNGIMISQRFLKGFGTRVMGVSEGGLTYWSRTFNYTNSTTLAVNNCLTINSSGGTTNNAAMIPMLIVGLKTGKSV